MSGAEPTCFTGFFLLTEKAGTGDAQEAWLQVCSSPHFSEGRLLLERFGLMLSFVGEFRDIQETLFSFEVGTKENNRSALLQTISVLGMGPCCGSATYLVDETHTRICNVIHQVRCELPLILPGSYEIGSSQRWGYVSPPFCTQFKPVQQFGLTYYGSGSVPAIKGDRTKRWDIISTFKGLTIWDKTYTYVTVKLKQTKM